MKKQNLMRSLFMAALLFGGIFIAGAANNVYAQTGGMIGSGTATGGLIGSGTRTEEGTGNGSNGVTGQTMGSGGRIMEPDSTTIFSLRSFWELFF